MKRFIIVILCFVLSLNLVIAQTGDGTFGNPYTGTLTQDRIWYPDSYSGGIIYAMNITIPSGLTLTISPGAFNGGLVQFGTSSLTIDAGGTFIINPQTNVTVRTIQTTAACDWNHMLMNQESHL